MNTEQNDNKPVIIKKSDFAILEPYMDKEPDAANPMSLAYELSRAQVVEDTDLDKDIVCLNAAVTIEDVQTHKQKTFTIVRPEQADIQKQRISVLTPMGGAIIGFRQGDEVKWRLPGGWKTFRIISVQQSAVSA